MLGHECSFPHSHFVDSVARNNKKSSGIEGKTSDCLSTNCLYVVFFADFLMVITLLVKNYQIKLLKMFGIFSWFCALDFINFPFYLRHTKTIKVLMCENE